MRRLQETVFQDEQDAMLAVSQGRYALYKMSLIDDATSPTGYLPRLDEDALAALQVLLPLPSGASATPFRCSCPHLSLCAAAVRGVAA